jgi:hypothetical protein
MATNIINQNLQNLQDPDTDMNQMIPEANNFALDIGSRVAPLGTFFAGTDYRSPNMDKNIMDIIENQGTQKGTIGYQDYDSKQPSNTAFPDLDGMMSRYSSGEISPAQFGNATQTGRMNYNLDPNTGQYNFTGNKYDFRPEVADQGGIFGYFANKANERGMDINPGSSTKAGYLSDYEAGENLGTVNDFYKSEQPASANSMGPEFYGSAPNKNFLTGILESLSDLELQDYLPFGEKSISSMAARGAGNMVRGIGNFFQGNPRQRARNEANKRFGVGDIYGYGMGPASGGNRLDAFGFNTVSGFGDYEQHMRDQLDKLNARKEAGKTFKPGSWQDRMLKDYGESISTIDAEAAAADRAERDKFNRMLSNMSGGGGGSSYGGTGYEGMSDAASDQERSEGGRGKR